MDQTQLSICIPTYNRARYLDECLASLAVLAPTYWSKVEIVVSDNASTDDTASVIDKYSGRLPIQYFRNSTNIGGERNFFAAASRGTASHVWVFGDDDVFEQAALDAALRHIELGFDLIVLNFSMWSLDMQTKVRDRGLAFRKRMEFPDADGVMGMLGSHLGYISSIIVRKEMYLSASESEWEPFVEYGFSHLFATYAGIRRGCRAIYLSDPAFRRREDNCLIFIGEAALRSWVKYFVEGTALVFEALQARGYAPRSVIRAKDQVLRDFITKRTLTGLEGVNRVELFRKMATHYKRNLRFWLVCVPALFVPRFVLKSSRATYLSLRRQFRNSGVPVSQ
jgi:abequosyltransferase